MNNQHCHFDKKVKKKITRKKVPLVLRGLTTDKALYFFLALTIVLATQK